MPNVDIKDELKRTSINITCYDRNGEIVKRVTSSDEDNNPNGGGSGNGSSTSSDTGNGGNSVTLTESDGTYTGTFQMPSANATLMINTGSTEGYGDTNQPAHRKRLDSFRGVRPFLF